MQRVYQSKACDQCNQKLYIKPLSIDSLNFSVITKRLCWELYPLRNPHWPGKCLSLKYS